MTIFSVKFTVTSFIVRSTFEHFTQSALHLFLLLANLMPNHLSLASFTFSAMSSIPHLLISSYAEIVSCQHFISSKPVSIPANFYHHFYHHLFMSLCASPSSLLTHFHTISVLFLQIFLPSKSSFSIILILFFQ